MASANFSSTVKEAAMSSRENCAYELYDWLILSLVLVILFNPFNNNNNI